MFPERARTQEMVEQDAVVFAQELVEADGAAHGKLKKVEMWPLQRGSRLAKVARIRQWKKKSGPRRTYLLLFLVIKGYQRSRKQKGCGQTSEIHTLQKGRSRRRWNCWRIFAAFLKTFETKFSHCLFWRRIWSWKSLEASRHSCCHREALHRRNDSSAVFQKSKIWHLGRKKLLRGWPLRSDRLPCFPQSRERWPLPVDSAESEVARGKQQLRRINRLGRSSPANNHIDLLAARRLLLKPGLMTVLKALEIYRLHRLGTLGRHPQTAFSQEDADILFN